MPLIDITTNLKSLKYGDFGAESPLITKSILNPPDSSGLSMEFERRKDDLVRIGKLLTTAPGLKHLANQAALNVIEKNISSKFDNKTAGGRILSGLGSTATSLASTLAQVPVNGTGTHFVESFAGKKGYLPEIQGHVLSRNGAAISIGADNFQASSSIFEDPNDLTKSGAILSRYQKDIEQKISSPSGSVLEPRTTTFPLLDTRASADSVIGAFLGISPGLEETIDKPKDEKLAYFQKEDALFASKFFNQNQLGFGASTINGDYTLPADAINDTIPLRTELSRHEELTLNLDEELQSEFFGGGDLIKFYFKLIEPGRTPGAEPKLTRMDFRAYLDSFNDNFSGDWNAYKYVGRAEDFHTYAGFDRSISFGFKIAASSAVELEVLYNKLNIFASSTAPSYVGNSFQRGTFMAVTIGDYLQDQLGFIESVDISWDTDYQWNTRFNNDPGRELPTILDISVSFKPIHMSIPKAASRFIGRKNDLFVENFGTDTAMEEIVVTANEN